MRSGDSEIDNKYNYKQEHTETSIHKQAQGPGQLIHWNEVLIKSTWEKNKYKTSVHRKNCAI